MTGERSARSRWVGLVAIADRVGRRRMLLVGVAISRGASVLAALAPTGDPLIGARVPQAPAAR